MVLSASAAPWGVGVEETQGLRAVRRHCPHRVVARGSMAPPPLPAPRMAMWKHRTGARVEWRVILSQDGMPLCTVGHLVSAGNGDVPPTQQTEVQVGTKGNPKSS